MDLDVFQNSRKQGPVGTQTEKQKHLEETRQFQCSVDQHRKREEELHRRVLELISELGQTLEEIPEHQAVKNRLYHLHDQVLTLEEERIQNARETPQREASEAVFYFQGAEGQKVLDQILKRAGGLVGVSGGWKNSHLQELKTLPLALQEQRQYEIRPKACATCGGRYKYQMFQRNSEWNKLSTACELSGRNLKRLDTACATCGGDKTYKSEERSTIMIKSCATCGGGRYETAVDTKNSNDTASSSPVCGRLGDLEEYIKIMVKFGVSAALELLYTRLEAAAKDELNKNPKMKAAEAELSEFVKLIKTNGISASGLTKTSFYIARNSEKFQLLLQSK